MIRQRISTLSATLIMKQKKDRPKGKPKRSDPKTNPESRVTPLEFSWVLHRATLASIFAIAAFLLYANTLDAPFVLDDRHNIEANPYVRLNTLTWNGIVDAGFKGPSSNRPVANISFALNHYLHQLHPTGYHAINILIHSATGIFLFLFLETLLSTGALRSSHETSRWIAFIAALIWLVHPLQTQSVTYIVQRMNSLAAMFYVLSLLLYAKARLVDDARKRWSLFSGCVLAGTLALGSKESAVTLPVFIFLYEWYFFQDLGKKWLKIHLRYVAAILLFLALAGLVYLGMSPWEHIKSFNDFAGGEFTLVERSLTQFRVVIHYISLLLYPHPSRLNLDHDFALSRSLMDPPATLLSLCVIVALVAMAVYLAKRERLASFCILWFFGNLIVESSVIPLAIIFEHRTYLPSMLICLMVVTLAHRFVRPKWLTVSALCAIVLVFSWWTFERNNVWKDDLRLWRDCVEKSPNKARPHNNLAVILYKRGELSEAMAQSREALRLDPEFAEASNNLGATLMKLGRPEEAIGHYEQALKVEPNYAEANSNMGVALYRMGRVEEAMDYYVEAVRINPFSAEAHNNLGTVYHVQGMQEQAIAHYSTALEILPDFAEAHFNLAAVLTVKGEFEEAIRHFSDAIRLNPDFAAAHRNLANLLASRGRFDEAITHYSEALRIDPTDAEVRRNMERVRRRVGQSPDAARPILRR
jgi:tetratricopeptide (TPR) repeat protein